MGRSSRVLYQAIRFARTKNKIVKKRDFFAKTRNLLKKDPFKIIDEKREEKLHWI